MRMRQRDRKTLTRRAWKKRNKDAAKVSDVRRQRPQNTGSSSLEKSLTRQHDCDEAAKVSGGRGRKTLARRAWKKRNKDAAKRPPPGLGAALGGYPEWPGNPAGTVGLKTVFGSGLVLTLL
ncbi:hypothetical protein G5714_010299 [Onychostoma macrolepis]|uniref:Uncharacterized protein n=1 Tax=Onychostoma macrolepis TaxID=369639 RepID=A0A7J6CPT9_9TELE|nr:hypothetical protein G5714_010299 [Onychostoma macrolepis]